jgi:hypothetical protein
MMVFSGVGLRHQIKENKMDKKFGYFIFGGLLIGALFGLLWSVNGNLILGIGTGALVGTAIGWFAAAYVMESEKGKSKEKK